MVTKEQVLANKDKKYAVTYYFGKTVVHVVAPPPMTEEEKQKKLAEFHKACWFAWESIPYEKQLWINEMCEQGREDELLYPYNAKPDKVITYDD